MEPVRPLTAFEVGALSGDEGAIMTGAEIREISRHVRSLWGVGPVAGMSDGQLLGRVASGRAEEAGIAFEALVSRHGPAVLATCRRRLDDPNNAEDAFQATFLVLLRRAGSIRVGDSVGPWLLGVARRVAARARVQEARRRSQLVSLVEHAAGPDRDPGLVELRTVLDEELQRLPARHRDAAMLCLRDGLTYEEAAGRLGCPVGTVKSRLARARERLRRRLERRGLAPSSALAAGPGAIPKVPTRLVDAAIAMMPRQAAGTVPATAARLADEVLKEMIMSKLKAVAVVALAIGLPAVAAMARQDSPHKVMYRVLTDAAGRPATTPEEKEEKEAVLEILKLEREWRDAIVRDDVEALDRFMADDYIAVDTGGTVRDKAAILAAHRDGDVPAESDEAIETKVRIYGDTAVVNGLSRWKAGNSEDIRITSVYVKRQGVWRCVSWQGMVVGD
jgi:RNA polymerase sigma factor (sigma-70 family)